LSSGRMGERAGSPVILPYPKIFLKEKFGHPLLKGGFGHNFIGNTCVTVS
jgi:hypothetical protein